jgi:hypothetical protein
VWATTGWSYDAAIEHIEVVESGRLRIFAGDAGDSGG